MLSEPVYDPEINPSLALLPDLRINPSPVELPYPNGNPCVSDPLSLEFSHHKQAADLLLAQNGSIVIQHFQKCKIARMKEGNLVVVAACPVVYAPSQHPTYGELDYSHSLGPLRTLGHGCPGSPGPTPRLHTGIKHGGPAVPQGVPGICDEAQEQHDSGQVKTEAVQQGTGYVGVRHSGKSAQAPASLEHVGVQPVGQGQVPVCHYISHGVCPPVCAHAHHG